MSATESKQFSNIAATTAAPGSRIGFNALDANNRDDIII